MQRPLYIWRGLLWRMGAAYHWSMVIRIDGQARPEDIKEWTETYGRLVNGEELNDADVESLQNLVADLLEQMTGKRPP